MQDKYGVAVAAKQLQRQREEGFTQAHDMVYNKGELIKAATSCLLEEAGHKQQRLEAWPPNMSHLRCLGAPRIINAAAFLLAEFERQNNEHMGFEAIQVAMFEDATDRTTVVFCSILAKKMLLPEYPMFTFYIHDEYILRNGVAVIDKDGAYSVTELHSRVRVCGGKTENDCKHRLQEIFILKGEQAFSDAIQNKKAEAELLAKNYAIKKAAL